MTRRESLQQIVEQLTDEEVDALLATIRSDGDFHAADTPSVVDGRLYPALAHIWDNEEDAIFDTLNAR